MKTIFIPVFFMIVSFLQAAPPSDMCRQETWVTDGTVYTILPAGNIIYIGGSFSHAGPYTGGGISIDASTGVTDPVFPKVNGYVHAVCPDGNGGWYVGGRFRYDRRTVSAKYRCTGCCNGKCHSLESHCRQRYK
jgi:hypothetical protein